MAKILLVEDNEMNHDMLSHRLTRRGFQVVIAVDGAQGGALALAVSPDLILMDMNLPVMDGWEATQRLKTAPETQAIPIIARPPTPWPATGQKRSLPDVTITIPNRLNLIACLAKSRRCSGRSRPRSESHTALQWKQSRLIPSPNIGYAER